VHARFGAQVAVHVVVYDIPCPSPPWASSVRVDREASLIPPSARFGPLRALLARPDGHIAAVARALDNRMLEYLATTLGPDPWPAIRALGSAPAWISLNQRRTM
jgi:hypothetical protein